MKRLTTVTKFMIGLMLSGLMINTYGQDVKAYKEGPVIEVSYIKIKPGKFEDYMKFLDSNYKSVMEAQKKAGLILGYQVYSAQARSPREADLILTITYPNMAALDKIAEAEAVTAKVMGNMDAQSKAAIGREPMREVLGSELLRELILK
ncbi:MAG: hypothetical protein V4447_05715 [Pseudomonadota bacterium]